MSEEARTYKPMINHKTRQCSACGQRITQVRPAAEIGKHRPRIWINADGIYNLHHCEKTTKIYSREEIDALERERGLK